MAYVDYITLNGKKYKVVSRGDDSYQRIFDRQKTDTVGLTGKTIMQDFTVSDREPHNWLMTLRVFISEPWPDSTWGLWSDLLTAYRAAYVPMIFFDGTTQWNVRIRSPLTPLPRVPANIDGHCYGIFYVNVDMVEVYQ
jgi:hypothetical protein